MIVATHQQQQGGSTAQEDPKVINFRELFPSCSARLSHDTVDCRHSLCAPCNGLQRKGEVRQDHNEKREREDQPEVALAIETSDSCRATHQKSQRH